MKEKLTSLSNPHIKELSCLKKSNPNLFLVEGFHLVEMASRYGDLVEVLSSAPYQCDCRCIEVTPQIISKLAQSKTPEGIIGVCKKRSETSFSSDRILLLDRVQDPGNIGTLLRSALCFGYKEVISISGSASFYNPKAIASSQGAIFATSLHENWSQEKAVEALKKEGYYLLGSSLANGVDFHSLSSLPKKACLILGNEGQGMSEYLLSKTDVNAYIPIEGIDSLNVGVAGGILMERFR